MECSTGQSSKRKKNRKLHSNRPWSQKEGYESVEARQYQPQTCPSANNEGERSAFEWKSKHSRLPHQFLPATAKGQDFHGFPSHSPVAKQKEVGQFQGALTIMVRAPSFNEAEVKVEAPISRRLPSQFLSGKQAGLAILNLIRPASFYEEGGGVQHREFAIATPSNSESESESQAASCRTAEELSSGGQTTSRLLANMTEHNSSPQSTVDQDCELMSDQQDESVYADKEEAMVFRERLIAWGLICDISQVKAEHSTSNAGFASPGQAQRQLHQGVIPQMNEASLTHGTNAAGRHLLSIIQSGSSGAGTVIGSDDSRGDEGRRPLYVANLGEGNPRHGFFLSDPEIHYSQSPYISHQRHHGSRRNRSHLLGGARDEFMPTRGRWRKMVTSACNKSVCQTSSWTPDSCTPRPWDPMRKILVRDDEISSPAGYQNGEFDLKHQRYECRSYDGTSFDVESSATHRRPRTDKPLYYRHEITSRFTRENNTIRFDRTARPSQSGAPDSSSNNNNVSPRPTTTAAFAGPSFKSAPKADAVPVPDFLAEELQ